MTKSLICDRQENDLILGENIILVGEVIGTGNRIEIEGTRRPTTLVVSMHGHGNYVRIGRQSLLNNLRLDIGSKRWLASETRLIIGEYFSIGSKGRFLLPNSGNLVDIGDHCMFSNSITVRAGEYPHLIFDLASGAYLDISDGIFIGNHSWIGEGAYITKGVTIPSECIVGAHSVVTKRFEAENTVIAGNPARVVKENIQWVANEKSLSANPRLKPGFEDSELNHINRRHERF